jgi:hypothetical protein
MVGVGAAFVAIVILSSHPGGFIPCFRRVKTAKESQSLSAPLTGEHEKLLF